MIYHFKLHKEKKGYWAECLEIPQCVTQGESLQSLRDCCHEAINLYLDEPEDSKEIFPLPFNNLKARKDILEVEVESSIAFAFLMRRTRLVKGLTQHEMKDLLQFKNLFAYQKLEMAKYANPTLKSLRKIKDCIPDFSFNFLF
jgi:predicted RNase H-like HicB family nuclease